MFLLILTFPLSIALQLFAQEMEVGGYLLDTGGAPVRDANITVFHGPPFHIGDMTESWKTFEDGYFGLVIEWKPGSKVWMLFEERPEGFYPLSNSELLDQKFFKGITISKYSKRKNFGKVMNYVRYGKTIIDVSNLSETSINNIERHQVFAKIRDTTKKLLSETSFKPALSKDRKEIVFMLPEGIWYIELIDKSTNEIVMPIKRVDIRSKRPFPLSLKTK